MIPFAPPRMDKKTVDAVAEVLLSTKTKKFEQMISQYCGNPATLCLNSATAGLEIMLRWFGVKEGDEVILPAYTYSATANVVMHCGAKPVFVDVKDDFNIDVKKVEAAITSKTKVIMPVDFGGLPCDYDELNSLVKRADIKSKFLSQNDNQKKLGRILILSDAAHSFGATYHGKRTGILTDVSVFSFHAVKNLTTAEGGAVALNLPSPFNNADIYSYLCVLTLHGQNKDALAKAQKGNWRYDIVEAGYKCNMTDIMAAIGIVELERYEETTERRKDIITNYNNSFSKYEWAQLPVFKNEIKESCYHVYPLRIRGITEHQRDEIIQFIFEKDVSVNVHFIPVPMLSFYKNLGYDVNNYPSALDSYSREISLPVFYNLTDEEQNIVVTATVDAVEKVLSKVSV
jgi:dTDP-4-amino-4,6-dideoxygalactose transaminase